MDVDFACLVSRFLKYAGPDDVTRDARLRDLGLDSMRAIELLFAVEDHYGITIPDEHLTDATFETGGKLWSVVEELRATADGTRP